VSAGQDNNLSHELVAKQAAQAAYAAAASVVSNAGDIISALLAAL
jgi:hypothetical protein